MKYLQRPFDFDRDFLSVRDFLSASYARYGHSVNWRIERWEYAFYFVTPFLANWRQPNPSRQAADAALAFLTDHLGLWETPEGDLAGLVTIEHADLTHPGYGEFFIQRHPDHLTLLPEMMAYAEQNLRNPATQRLFIHADPEDTDLIPLLEAKGFQPDPSAVNIESEFNLESQPLPETTALPKGFHLQSMAENNDLPRRCKAFGCAFNHPDPLEWPAVLSYEDLQHAPDYRKEHDIVVVAPGGEMAAFCLIWHDQPNQIAILEPVGAQPAFRRMGLAREAVFEAMRRVRNAGTRKVIVGSGQKFYQLLGFAPVENRIKYEKPSAK